MTTVVVFLVALVVVFVAVVREGTNAVRAMASVEMVLVLLVEVVLIGVNDLVVT